MVLAIGVVEGLARSLDPDLDLLTRNTNYSEEEIRKWFNEFIRDCPDGSLSKDRVKEMMNVILIDHSF